MSQVQPISAPPSTAASLATSQTKSSPWSAWVKRAVSFSIVITLFIILWEGVKVIGGDPWRIQTEAGPQLIHNPPFRWKIASDLNLPHIWEILFAFFQPAVRNGPLLITVLAEAAFYTFLEAFTGFLLGTLLGLSLGIIFAHFPLLERSLVPYVVASQTVPIIAIAPMVVIWLNAGWWSVAIIAAYLTFFPVTINTLRGLRSPDPMAIDLMRSYAASRRQILWKLRFPAALPLIFTALKISATASVVGAIIGELPSGIQQGLGGAILNFNQYYTLAPERLWATIIMAAFVGITFFIMIRLAEFFTLRHRSRED